MVVGLFIQRAFGSAYRRFMYRINRRFISYPLCACYRVPSPSGCVPGLAAGFVRAGFVFSPIGAPGLLSPTRPVCVTGLLFVPFHIGLIGIIIIIITFIYFGPVLAGLTGIMPSEIGLLLLCACWCRAYHPFACGAVCPDRACTRGTVTIPSDQGQIVVADLAIRLAMSRALSGRGVVRVPWCIFMLPFDVLFIRC